METAEKKVDKAIVWESFLREENVSVKPIESSGKWATLLVKGEDEKMRKQPHLYNKVKRSFQVPLQSIHRGGGVKTILDDMSPKMIQKYKNEFPNGMTQKQFFEKELGVDLSVMLPIEENFWRTHKNGRVTITKTGLTLNLRLPLDMIKYLILMSDKSKISPTYEERLNKATYEFMLVNEDKITSKVIEDATVEAEAWMKYSQIVTSKAKMIQFIKSLGRTVPVNHTEDWLKNEILSVLKKSFTAFISIIDHPHYEAKVFIQNAIEAGALNKMSDKRYTLDNGVELGDLNDTIAYFSDVKNQDVKARTKAKIDLAKR